MKGLALLVLYIAFMSIACADSSFGMCNFGKQTVSEVVCDGPALLKGTTVSGDVKVAGAMRASNVTMRALKIAGSTELDNATVNGTVDVTGKFQANGVDFKQALNLTTDQVLLDNSTVQGSVTITSSSTKPYLKLQCNSTVTGSVTFNGMAGVAQVTEDSIIQGKIINGTMEFVQKQCPNKQ